MCSGSIWNLFNILLFFLSSIFVLGRIRPTKTSWNCHWWRSSSSMDKNWKFSHYCHRWELISSEDRLWGILPIFFFIFCFWNWMGLSHAKQCQNGPWVSQSRSLGIGTLVKTFDILLGNDFISWLTISSFWVKPLLIYF